MRVGFFTFSDFGKQVQLKERDQITFNRRLKTIFFTRMDEPIRDPDLEAKLRDNFPETTDCDLSIAMLIEKIHQLAGFSADFYLAEGQQVIYEVCDGTVIHSIHPFV